MKTHSAKQKGRRAQQYIRDQILKAFPELTKDDVRSTSMGAQGEDIQLSPVAKFFIPFYIESKSRKSFSIYTIFEGIPGPQNSRLLVIKENNKKPLAVLDLDTLLHLLRGYYDSQEVRETERR